jgi:hypothetical protein
MKTLSEFVKHVRETCLKDAPTSEDGGKTWTDGRLVNITFDPDLLEELENMLAKENLLIRAVKEFVSHEGKVRSIEDLVHELDRLSKAADNMGKGFNIIAAIRGQAFREAARAMKPIPHDLVDATTVRSVLLQRATEEEKQSTDWLVYGADGGG